MTDLPLSQALFFVAVGVFAIVVCAEMGVSLWHWRTAARSRAVTRAPGFPHKRV